jgi:hypothetical protein
MPFFGIESGAVFQRCAAFCGSSMQKKNDIVELRAKDVQTLTSPMS